MSGSKPYIIILCLCGVLVLGCEQSVVHDDDTQVVLAHADVLLDSLELAVSSWDEDYIHDKLLLDNRLEIIHVHGRRDQRSRLALVYGRYYLNLGLFDAAVARLAPMAEEYEHIRTPTAFAVYELLERCYSYGSDEVNKLSVLHDMVIKLDTTVLGDSLLAWVNHRHASYNFVTGDIDKANIYLDQNRSRIEKWQIKDLQLMQRLTPYIILRDHSTAYLLQTLDSMVKIQSWVDQASPWYQNIYYSNLGDIYYHLDQPENTLATTLKEEDCARHIEEVFVKRKELGSTFINLADAYKNVGELDLADAYLDSARHHLEFTRYRSKIPYYWNQIELHHLRRHPLDSMQRVFYEMAYEARDHLRTKATREMEALESTRQGEQRLIRDKANLLRDKLILQRNLLLSGGVMLLGALGLFIMYQRMRINRERHQNQLLKMRSQLLAGQLNPHFIQNALQRIMFNLEGRAPAEYDQLEIFSGLLRHTFKYFQSDNVKLSEELEMLKRFFRFEQSKLMDHEQLTFDIDVHDQIDQESTRITPLILQSILDNAIKKRKVGYKNEIRLEFKKSSDQFLTCKMSDTGLGVQDEIDVFDEGHSLYHIKRLNDTILRRSSLSISPRPETRGCIVTVLLPYSISPNDEDHNR